MVRGSKLTDVCEAFNLQENVKRMVQLYYLLLFYSLLRAASQHTVDIISAEERDVILPINVTKVSEVSWILSYNHIATSWPNGSINVKKHRLKGRLHGMDGGSLIITKVTRKDQGTYTANVFIEGGNDDVHQQFHLKVYPVLSLHDIDIRVNMTSNGTCSGTLTCLVNASNVNVSWNYLNNSDLHISDRTLCLYKVYQEVTFNCTAENPISKVTKTISPWEHCQQEGQANQQQMDGSAQKWITVIVFTVIFVTVIILIFLYYKKWRSKNVDIKMKADINTICDTVVFPQTSLRHLQSHCIIYAQLNSKNQQQHENENISQNILYHKGFV